MKAKSILTTAAIFAVALFILDVPAASADTKYFYHTEETPQAWSSAYWYTDTEGGGSSTTEPDSTDHAIIEADCKLSAHEECQSFYVNSSVYLYLADGATGYRLDVGDADGRTSTVLQSQGVQLSDDTSVLRFLYSHTVTGGGTLDGQDNGAKIEIADSETLTSSTTIEGNCQILPVVDATSTTFLNSGTVHANNPGTLDLAVDSLDSPSGAWQVSSSSTAILKFSIGSTTMTGIFTVNEGTLDIDDSVDTGGRLIFSKSGDTNPKIDVAGSGVYFAASQP